MKAAGHCVALLGAALMAPQEAGAADVLATYSIQGDAIAEPLEGSRGNAVAGAALMADRQRSLCVLCHSGPFPNPHLQGTLAPDLTGIGARLSEGQIRLRIVDMKHLNPQSIMPAYYRLDAGERVAGAWRGKPVLQAGEIEDLVAYLVTLKD
ncbi:MAG: soxX [Xanthobacteraceae bacterium]|jgi:sulfur-oxidizing protein SoxX|nr:soxX [Xanthobacteraceae bacterium]